MFSWRVIVILAFSRQQMQFFRFDSIYSCFESAAGRYLEKKKNLLDMSSDGIIKCHEKISVNAALKAKN